MTNAATPAIRTPTRLNMSEIRPATPTNTARASRKAFTTHCSSVWPRSRSAWIDGRATLTTVESSIIIDSVPVMAARIHQRRAGPVAAMAGVSRTYGPAGNPVRAA